MLNFGEMFFNGMRKNICILLKSSSELINDIEQVNTHCCYEQYFL